MNSRGHIGLTLTILSLTLIALGSKGVKCVAFLILAALLSPLPDIDLRIKIPHRRYTHNILFITLTSVFFGYLTSVLLSDFNLGFYSSLTSGLIHLLGDLMTYMAFSPIYPISDVNISLRLFRSDDRLVNNLLLVVGILTFTTYLII